MNFLKGCDIVTDNAAIQFEHANYQVDGLAILRDINDFFPEGKITALVGPSGAGKTTVFKLCNGLASPTSGKIYFNQKSVDTYEPVELRRRIGLALQDATMIQGTVRENLALPLELQAKQLSNETAEQYMNLVGLKAEFLTRDVRDLSDRKSTRLNSSHVAISYAVF